MAGENWERATSAMGGPAGGAIRDVTQVLQLVADTIVESLGFEVAVVNLVEEDAGSMVVAAVSGPDAVREALLSRRQGREGWATLIAASEPWGRLRFLDHASSPADPDDIVSWTPDLAPSDNPDAWHPEDSLFALLESSDGQLIGILSVDLPRDGLRPGPATTHALEAFAVTASLAIEHAALAALSRRGARRFQAVFDLSPVPIALLGPDGRLTSVNDAFCRFFARAPGELVGRSPLEFTHPEDVLIVQSASARVRSVDPLPHGTRESAVEKRYLLPDGSVVWGRLHLAALDSPDEPGSLIAQLEDITERKNAEERLLRLAHFDTLTSLPNRSESMRQLREDIAADTAAGTMTVVFFCDLDRLKLVNDGHGHAVGDAYLCEAGRRIRASVRDTDLVGRLGGDEFVVILTGVQTPAEAVALASRVIEGVRQPLLLGDLRFTPHLSLGIAYSWGAATTADALLAQADAAMYRAKLQGRGDWQVYDPTTPDSDRRGRRAGGGPPAQRAESKPSELA